MDHPLNNALRRSLHGGFKPVLRSDESGRKPIHREHHVGSSSAPWRRGRKPCSLEPRPSKASRHARSSGPMADTRVTSEPDFAEDVRSPPGSRNDGLIRPQLFRIRLALQPDAEDRRHVVFLPSWVADWRPSRQPSASILARNNRQDLQSGFSQRVRENRVRGLLRVLVFRARYAECSGWWLGSPTTMGGPGITRAARYRPHRCAREGAQMSTTPIADYALLSDRHSAALVSRDGSIDWLCFPRFDSPSIFGRLLGEEAGHWSIRPTNATEVTRRYLDRTMVLETTFRTPTGTVAITDALAMGAGNRGHELGRDAPHLFLRGATCLEGEVELSLEYVPRPEYGLVRPVLDPVEGGVSAAGGADVLVLSLSRADPLTVEPGLKGLQPESSSASPARSANFALSRRQAEAPPTSSGPKSEITRTARRHRVGVGIVVRSSTRTYMQSINRDLIAPQRTSAPVALSYAPTGRSAQRRPRKSPPEAVRAPENWDYRYAWVRGAAIPSRSRPSGWQPALTKPMSSSTAFEAHLGRPAQLDQGGDLQNHVWHQGRTGPATEQRNCPARRAGAGLPSSGREQVPGTAPASTQHTADAPAPWPPHHVRRALRPASPTECGQQAPRA